MAKQKITQMPMPVAFDSVIASVSGASISFSDVVKKYAVSAGQLKEDMKELRWRQVGREYFFELKQIRSRYDVDSDKLMALAELERMEAEKVIAG